MKFYSFDLDLDSLTIVLKLDLDIVKTYVCTLAVQKLYPEHIHKQRQTD